MQTLDNEASDILLEYMRNNKIDIQLAPPHIHRRNLAERAIRTFKEHFKALRASCDPLFPKHLWCRLLQQATLSLNLLREARLHPQLSSYHALWGAFDYNRTPLAPQVRKYWFMKNHSNEILGMIMVSKDGTSDQRCPIIGATAVTSVPLMANETPILSNFFQQK